MPKSIVLRTLMLLSLGLLLTLAALLYYVQTPHGFRHLLLPVMARATGAEVEARDGSVSLSGTAAVEGLTYRDPRRGIELTVDRLRLDLAVSPFLRGQPILVQMLEVAGASLSLSITGPQDGPAQSPASEPTAAWNGGLLPVAIDQARFEDVSLALTLPERTVYARNAAMQIDRLRPGERGLIKVFADWLVDEHEGAMSWSGTLRSALELEIDADRTEVRWTGTNGALVGRGAIPVSPGDPGVLALQQALSGEADLGTGALTVHSTVEAQRGRVAAGVLTADLTVTGEGETRRSQASLVLDRVDAQALNTWLDALTSVRTDVRLQTADVTGRLDLTKTGPKLQGRLTLDAKQLGVLLPGQDRVPPPVDVGLDHGFVYDEAAQDLTIDRLTASMNQGTRSMIEMNLDRPLVLDLDGMLGEVREGGGAPPLASAGPAVLTVTVNHVTFEDIRPWLDAGDRAGFHDVRSGELNGAITVTAQGGGETITVAGGIDLINLGVIAVKGKPPLDAVALQNQVRATLSKLTTLKVDACDSILSVRGTTVGRAHAEGSVLVHEHVFVQEAVVEWQLAGLSTEHMNVLLPASGVVRWREGTVTSRGKLLIKGDQVGWQAGLEGKQISLLMRDVPAPTPPLDLILQHAGTWNRTSRQLRLEQALLKVAEQRQPVLVGAIDHPFTVTLGPAAESRGQAGAASPVALTLDLNRLSVQQLRSWARLIGSNALDSAMSGSLGGRVRMQVRGTGETIDLDSALEISDLRLKRQGTDQPAGPIRVGSQVQASMRNLSQVTIQPSGLRVEQDQRVLVEMKIAGALDPEGGATDLSVEAGARNVADALDQLGILDSRQRRLLTGGSLSSQTRVTSAGRRQPLRVETRTRVQGLVVQLPGRPALTQHLGMKGVIDIDGARRETVLDHLTATLESPGTEAGSAVINGHWPLAAADKDGPSRPGEVAVTVTNWDAGPLADILGLVPQRQPGPLPVAAQIAVTRDAAAQTVVVRGTERVGPLRVTAAGAAPLQATIEIEHDVRRRSNEIGVKELTVTVDRGARPVDRVRTTGIVDLGKRPRAELHAVIERLDGTLLAGLLSEPTAGPSGGSTQGAGGIRTGGEAASSEDHPLDVDAEVEIGLVTFRGLTVEKGRVTAKRRRGNLHVLVNPTMVAGGSVEAVVDLVKENGHSAVTWKAGGKQLNVSTMFRALHPDQEPPLVATASFHTEGTGVQGPSFAQTLTGTVVLDLTEGKVLQSGLMRFIAEQTGIKEFDRLDFSAAHAEARVKDGWVDIKKLRVDASAMVLKGTGRVGMDGRLDMRIDPRIGPKLAPMVRGACFAPLLKTVDGLTAFPFAVVLRGTIDQPEYRIQLTVGDHLGKEAGRVVPRLTQVLEGCAGTGLKGAEQVIQGLGGAAQGLLDGLFGGEKRSEQPKR